MSKWRISDSEGRSLGFGMNSVVNYVLALVGESREERVDRAILCTFSHGLIGTESVIIGAHLWLGIRSGMIRAELQLYSEILTYDWLAWDCFLLYSFIHFSELICVFWLWLLWAGWIQSCDCLHSRPLWAWVTKPEDQDSLECEIPPCIWNEDLCLLILMMELVD